MPTGGGKSICYQLPALIKTGITIVVSPLIALMKDQVESLKANGIAAEFINSSLSALEERAIITRCISNEIKLLYLSPEKILSLADNFLKQLPLALFAIDEAHCISQWGHDFRPEYNQLKTLRTLFPAVPVIALTATADKVTRKDIIKQLELKEPRIFIASFDRPNLNLIVRSNIKESQKYHEIIEFISSRRDESGIIYCLSRKGTETICSILTAAGIQSAYYHAGMDAASRNKVQEAFIFDNIKIICATIASGMGIDKSNVRWVIHFNLPKNIEGYYQEIGRSGRDGVAAQALLYYNIKDLIMLNKFAAESGQSELNLEKLKRMQQFAEAKVCRRKILLSYFGENFDRNCNNCDVCKNPPKYFDGTIIAQKAISALLRSHESVNINMLIDILRGSMNAELIAKGFDKLKTHGAGREFSAAIWQRYILQLMQIGIFEMAYDEGFILKVSDFGKKVINSNLKIDLVEHMQMPVQNEKKKAERITNNDSALFESLRQLRKQIAAREGFPPYIIFTDATLLEMADKKPKNKFEMMQINGVSHTKYLRYAYQFEQIFTGLPTHTPVEEPFHIEEDLSDEKITAYYEELRKYPIRISHAVLGKLLTGTDRSLISEDLKQLSFYGKLIGRTTYREIAPVLLQYFKKREIRPGASYEIDATKYFDPPLFNNLNSSEIETAKHTVSQFFLNRPTLAIDNDYIINTRKEFHRAYEYWSEEENELLLSLCKKTNDLDILASILLRNPGNIKVQYRKMAGK
jgi:ATP-dependent DNA helicase RecQ